VSILKFIEATGVCGHCHHSHDYLPNPTVSLGNPYVSANEPDLGDPMSIFDFSHKHSAPPLIIPGAI